MMGVARTAVGLLAVALAGVAIGVTLTVWLSGWTGSMSLLVARAVPPWVGTAETLATACGAGAAVAGLAWIGLDYADA